MKSLPRLLPPCRGRARRGVGSAGGEAVGVALRFPVGSSRPRSLLPPRALPKAVSRRQFCPRGFFVRAMRAGVLVVGDWVLVVGDWVLVNGARVRLRRHFRPRRPSLFIITRPSIIGGRGRAAHRSATTRRWYHVARAPGRR